ELALGRCIDGCLDRGVVAGHAHHLACVRRAVDVTVGARFHDAVAAGVGHRAQPGRHATAADGGGGQRHRGWCNHLEGGRATALRALLGADGTIRHDDAAARSRQLKHMRAS
ncbi:MAG: hypothetical protein ACK55I_27175, partial [bacterium]